MIHDPAFALQKAIYMAIVATGAVQNRVYSEVPHNSVKPYAQIGDDFVMSNREAGEFHDATAVVNIVGSSKREVKAIVGQVRRVLEAEIAIEGFIVHEYLMSSANYRMASDGLTAQATLEIDYLIQTAE